MARTVDPTRLEGLRSGRIEAAAGCGKTDAIVQLTAAWNGRRTLILTHTLAGVAALRKRLQAARIPSDRFSLSSIDAWCVRRVSEFPLRAGPLPDARIPSVFYPGVRLACLGLLDSHAIDLAIKASYGRVFVDEYQDCGPVQHAIVCRLAGLLPTFVLGDPLQAIFNFRQAPVVSWEDAVTPAFPLIETLDHPWRWERVGAGALGQWLIRVRASLLDGTGVDLEQLPAGCEWRRLSGDPGRDSQTIRTAASYWQRQAGSVLVLAHPEQPVRHADLARGSEGVQVVENLDLQRIAEHMSALDAAHVGDRLRKLLELAHAVMTGVAVETILNRCSSLRAGRARTPATLDETAALAFLEDPSWSQARELLQTLRNSPDRRVFRRAVLTIVLESFASVAAGRHGQLADAMGAARERLRHKGRSVSPRSIGSTLLLKGLESDYTVLVDVEQLSPAHIYVALTRGTRGMLVCSRERWIGRDR